MKDKVECLKKKYNQKKIFIENLIYLQKTKQKYGVCLWAMVVANGERGPQHSTGYPMWIEIIFTSKQEAIWVNPLSSPM